MNKRRKNKRQSKAAVIVFCILIFIFTAATIIKPPTEFSENENRVLAKMPKINTETVFSGEFEKEYEKYLTDQFIFRDSWIGMKTTIEKLILKKESKDIYFASDDYLIEKHTNSFNTDLAEQNIISLADFTQMYQNYLGTEHISVMIVPNAVDILNNKFPPFASSHIEEDYLEKIEKSLSKDSWFDTESILKKHSDEDVFYKTDHHWTTLAAFYVYREWATEQGYSVPNITDYEIKTVTNSFQGTIQSKLGIQTKGDSIELFLPKKETDYIVYDESTGQIKSSIYDDSALDTKDKYAIFFGGNQSFLKINTTADGERKILVIKDSYANCFIPFMLSEFKQIDVLDIRYDRKKVSERIAEGNYTDILVLYNASGFAEDTGIAKLTK